MKSKQKRSLDKLFDNKRFLMAFAIAVAILLYFLVAMDENEIRTVTISGVPVELELQAANLTNLRLEVIEGAEYTVDIQVSGPRTVVGQLSPDSPELLTTASVSQISESGTYPLQVVSAYTGDMDFKILRYTPSTIQVTFDRLVSRTFTIDKNVKGISAQPPYIYDKEYVTPETVTVTGPEAEIGIIAGAEVELDLTEPLEANRSWPCPIILKDAQGEEIDPDAYHFNMSATEAQLAISVLKETGLPLMVEFLNTPRDFPVNELEALMTTSVDYLKVAGPPVEIDRYTEWVLGYVDIKDLRPGNNYYTFSLDLPDTFKASENITSVTVIFDDVEWETATFTVDDIALISPPANLDVELMTTRLENIEIVGKADILETLTADDIIVEVNLSDREITTGQYNYPVKISAPGKGLVWAVGDYTVVIHVEEKE